MSFGRGDLSARTITSNFGGGSSPLPKLGEKVMSSKKKHDIWMPLYISDYLSDTMHLNTEQHGAYLLLIMSAWKSDGRLPNDALQLQSISRLTPQKWKAFEEILSSFFFVTQEFWIHNRVRNELLKAKKNTEERAEAGAKGAAARWRKNGNE
jgi:uncharacterized protein YdaU (DUF1376 family)